MPRLNTIIPEPRIIVAAAAALAALLAGWRTPSASLLALLLAILPVDLQGWHI